ncbi:MAG: riboflavin synthase [Candidatus Nanopelagicales bacterium]
MFTGIVEEVGHIARIDPLDHEAVRLTVTANTVLEGTVLGDSIAVSGVCLTVAELTPTGFGADVMPETLRRTALADATPGSPVNLERAATPATRLGGHLVSGHVDGTGRLRSRQPAGDFDELVVTVPDDLSRYLVAKGSICVDGVSLTVVGTGSDDDGHWFSVALIPTTLRHTTLGTHAVGDTVNLEVDVIAKYVERMLSARST